MGALEQIGDFCSATKDFFTALGKGLWYLGHPAELAKVAFNSIYGISFFGCMIVCIGGVIAYIIGYKKGKKFAIGSVMIYILINMIKVGM